MEIVFIKENLIGNMKNTKVAIGSHSRHCSDIVLISDPIITSNVVFVVVQGFFHLHHLHTLSYICNGANYQIFF